jgi:phosphonate transport system ATP-binding protein
MASALAHSADSPLPEAPVRHDLEVRGLVKRFGSAPPILDGVDLRVPHGQSLALLGSNGAGKSTLLRCCLRLVESEGEVRVLGQDVRALGRRQLRALRSRVGFVFQRHNLVPRLSALTNVLHGAQSRRHGPRAWFQGLAPRELREEAMRCLELVGLGHMAGQRADRLSGGQSQRVAIARMLMQRPDFVIADEPVASLDPAAGEEVMRLLVRLLRERDLTLIFISHDLRHAVEFADRVIGLRGGRIELDGAAAEQDPGRLAEIYE